MLKLLAVSSSEEFFDDENGKVSFWNKDVIVFPEYETEARSLNDLKDSLKQNVGALLDCIVNTLGIMYRGKHDTTFRYYFIHHHVRDYFAGFYEIQCMCMAAALKREYLDTKRQTFIDHAFDALS